MPKQRINREMVVDAAFSIARREGTGQVLVKRIAEELHCSVQPIYSYLSNMDELRKAVADKAASHMQEYMARNIDPADPFRSTGLSYIRYAREEPCLFQLFLQRKRPYLQTLPDLYGREADLRVPQRIAQALGVTPEEAMSLHLNMLVFTAGIGSIIASSPEGVAEEELLSRLLLDETGCSHRVPCPKGKVVNSVGAGDSMLAGFLAGFDKLAASALLDFAK